MFEIFILWPPALLIGAVLLGLVIGSFLNVVAYRLPLMMEREWREQCAELAAEADTLPTDAREAGFSLWRPRSRCANCATPIAAWQNIPVLSYLLLRGRCKQCGARISVRYPVVEAAAGILALAVAVRFGPSLATVAALGFSWTLLVLSVIDIDRQLLPDSLTLPLLWAGLCLSLVDPAGNASVLFTDPRSSIIGAGAGYLSLWLVYHLFKLVTGKEGMGYGDFKLLAAIGAWLGWQVLPMVILLSAAVGAVVGIGLILFAGHGRQTPIPFGPYLAAAGWIALMWGEQILQAYTGLLI
jgi:leader peptidase (prepilin peptidase)/N-methyltransferase